MSTNNQKQYKNEQYLIDQYIKLGKTTSEIAKECGVTPASIHYNLKKYGLSKKQRKEKQAEVILVVNENKEIKHDDSQYEYLFKGKRLSELEDLKIEITLNLMRMDIPKTDVRKIEWRKQLHALYRKLADRKGSSIYKRRNMFNTYGKNPKDKEEIAV